MTNITNSQIETLGIDAVIEYEKKAGRTVVKTVNRCGFDIITKKPDGSDERHIEIKASSKPKFTYRWLEPLEEEKLQTDPLFFLYLVTQAGSDSPRVREYTKKEMDGLRKEIVSRPQYHFPPEHFSEK